MYTHTHILYIYSSIFRRMNLHLSAILLFWCSPRVQKFDTQPYGETMSKALVKRSTSSRCFPPTHMPPATKEDLLWLISYLWDSILDRCNWFRLHTPFYKFQMGSGFFLCSYEETSATVHSGITILYQLTTCYLKFTRVWFKKNVPFWFDLFFFLRRKFYPLVT